MWAKIHQSLTRTEGRSPFGEMLDNGDICAVTVHMHLRSPIVVTIDGWSSCGKSTLARQLAQRLDYLYIDSGAMYRAITLYFLRYQVDFSDPLAVAEALRHIHLSFVWNNLLGQSEMHLNDENVEQEIRGLAVAQQVSEVAAIADVRTFAIDQQRLMGQHKGIVMDGRDIGTVVFPQAELKIFMTADMDVRVQRRYQEMAQKNPSVDLQEVRKNLEQRDYLDSHRIVSPLRQAADAVLIDNTFISREEQLQLAWQWVKDREGHSS